jgi:hypothetical protein
MIVGGYTLDLYCDNDDRDDHHFTGGEFWVGENWSNKLTISHQFVGETFAQAARKARRDGWIVNRSKNKCLCPACSRKGR